MTILYIKIFYNEVHLMAMNKGNELLKGKLNFFICQDLSKLDSSMKAWYWSFRKFKIKYVTMEIK